MSAGTGLVALGAVIFFFFDSPVVLKEGTTSTFPPSVQPVKDAGSPLEGGAAGPQMPTTASRDSFSGQLFKIKDLPLAERVLAFDRLVIQWQTTPRFEAEVLSILQSGADFQIAAKPDTRYSPRFLNTVRLKLLAALEDRLSAAGGAALKELVLQMKGLHELAWGVRVIEAWSPDAARDLAGTLARKGDFKGDEQLGLTTADFGVELLARFGDPEFLDFVRGTTPEANNFNLTLALWALPEEVREAETIRLLEATETHMKQISLVPSLTFFDLSSGAVKEAAIKLFARLKHDETRVAMIEYMGSYRSLLFPHQCFELRPLQRPVERPAKQMQARLEILEALRPQFPQGEAAFSKSISELKIQQRALANVMR